MRCQHRGCRSTERGGSSGSEGFGGNGGGGHQSRPIVAHRTCQERGSQGSGNGRGMNVDCGAPLGARRGVQRSAAGSSQRPSDVRGFACPPVTHCVRATRPWWYWEGADLWRLVVTRGVRLLRSVSRERQPHGVPKEWDGRSQCTTLAALVRTDALVLVTASRYRCVSLSTSATDAARMLETSLLFTKTVHLLRAGASGRLRTSGRDGDSGCVPTNDGAPDKDK